MPISGASFCPVLPSTHLSRVQLKEGLANCLAGTLRARAKGVPYMGRLMCFCAGLSQKCT